jgi:hypothetical protein
MVVSNINIYGGRNDQETIDNHPNISHVDNDSLHQWPKGS